MCACANQTIPLSVLARDPHKGLVCEISHETGRGRGKEGPREEGRTVSRREEKEAVSRREQKRSVDRREQLREGQSRDESRTEKRPVNRSQKGGC